MGAAPDHLPGLEHDDLVGSGDGRDPLADSDQLTQLGADLDLTCLVVLRVVPDNGMLHREAARIRRSKAPRVPG